MANTPIPGFQPARVRSGSPITFRRCLVLTNNTTAIFKGDAVKVTAAGDYVVATSVNTAISSVMYGGAVYTDTSSIRREAQFLPAATLYTSTVIDPDNASYIYVVDDELDTEFRASGTTVIAQTNLFNTFAMLLGAGSTTTGLSGHSIDNSTSVTTNTFPWRLVDFVRGSADTDPQLASAACYFRINRSASEPALGDGTGT